MTEEIIKPQYISKEKHLKVLKRICPDCGRHLIERACGGLSINVWCDNCGAGFNDMFVFGSERIKRSKIK